ncbi:hypothetical protein CASFOL_027000 [Castilleja foliolosa]|uniref:Stigma-specific Stig1 family protein n=1 Tax=Castilleja foliolosa TaxID=1961234 RepID=A0ABD3CJH3_9LAMI
MIRTMKLFVKPILFTIIAATIALTLIVNFGGSPPPPDHLSEPADVARPVSRFLQQTNPRPAAYQCNRDNVFCYISAGTGRSMTCCNKKCVDLGYDNENCGTCNKRCAFEETCCNGKCVNLGYDKTNCGFCNNWCMPGNCVFGMCGYA